MVVASGQFFEVLANIPDSDVYGRLIADAAYIFIAGGAVIFLIAFLGCCGAMKKSQCMLMTVSLIDNIWSVLVYNSMSN